MPESPVGLASIGLGWWGNVLAEAALSGGNARVVACFARTPEMRDTFAAKHGCRAAASLDEIWGDPEVEGVLIATPHTVRQELIAQAAAAGEHVLSPSPSPAGRPGPAPRPPSKRGWCSRWGTTSAGRPPTEG